MATPTERLTSRLAAGDEGAFEEFHASYFNRLYAFVLAVTRGSDEETREIMQQTFLRVLRYVRTFREEEVFWSWLKAVARSVARDNGRKQRRYLDFLTRLTCFWRREPPSDVSNPEPALHMILDEALQALAPADRDLIEAKYVEGFRVAELAAREGISEKALESRLLRLRRELRMGMLRKLKEEEEEHELQ